MKKLQNNKLHVFTILNFLFKGKPNVFVPSSILKVLLFGFCFSNVLNFSIKHTFNSWFDSTKQEF